ncbi:MAG: hypothetical protein ABI691_13505 [Ginsengibacter sp.]
MKLLLLVMSLFIVHSINAQKLADGSIWKISNRNSIVWNISKASRIAHSDNIEMAGLNIAAIISYGVDESRNLTVRRDLIYPQLRTFNKSNEPEGRKHRAYLRHTYDNDILPNIYHKGKILVFNKVDSIEIAGKLIFYQVPVQGIALTRTLMPSMTERLFVEKWQLTNRSDSIQQIVIGNTSYQTSIQGYKGQYNLHAYTDSMGAITILPGQQYSFAVYFSAGINDEVTKGFDFRKVENERDNFLTKMQENLVLETPDKVLNTLFYFSKIRAAESIYNSKMGKVHSPGGGNYYVGVWANDQVEYSGPFFPFLGYDIGNEAAYNAYKMFLKNIPENFIPISSSFEIDGELPCCGKDRGDAAMIAFGTSQFLLLRGDKEMAKELWPLVEWSLEYCNRMLNKDGIVRSKTDEMEGRIATGSANLSTNSLYYGGLKFSSRLAKELGLNKEAKIYLQRLKDLEVAIEKQFGYNLEGLETYRYFVGNTHLRHWICLPLVMGIDKRSEATATALLDKLWTENGVLVELNPSSTDANVFWDRGTLYALRGTFKAGAIEKSLSKLEAFSTKRLLGDHVPYVIEAYPENNMRHLSAESALYCRIFIEGLLGFEQTGFRSFVFKPVLPSSFNEFALNKIHLADTEISIHLKRSLTKIQVMIHKKDSLIYDKTVDPRQTVSIAF